MALLPRRWREQPRGPVAINWSHPISRGLVFCAVPVGNVFLDVVTNVLGVRTGALTASARGRKGGQSTDAGSWAVTATGGASATDQVIWPVSTDRGGSIIDTGTVLCLGGSTAQVDGVSYPMGGNTDAVGTGDGFALHIDSFLFIGRGNVLKGRYTTANSGSTSSFLGNPFNDQTHFFGFSFNSNGAAGKWFGAGTSEAYSAQTTHGTATTNRRAILLAPSDLVSSSVLARNSFVSLFLMWNREITALEYLSLYLNPWQLFQAPLRPTLDTPPGLGGPAGPAPVGTIGQFDPELSLLAWF